MRRSSLLFSGLVVLLAIAPVWPDDRSALSPSQCVEQLEQYKLQVHELSTAPQRAPQLYRSIPKQILVHTSRGDISVNTEFLSDELLRFQRSGAKDKLEILSALRQRLDAMRAEAHEYDQPSYANDAIRAKLKQILSAPEFNRVHGPTELELLEERISAWINRQLNKLSPKIPEVSDLGQIFVWAMIALTSAILAVWLYRESRRRLADRSREILSFSPSDKSWRVWLKEAHDQASAGKWRDAIHFGYWAAVSRLESERLWRPDKARTPREYLNALPAENLARAPFAVVTSKFESSWYGRRPTSGDDFAQFVTELERLGCR